MSEVDLRVPEHKIQEGTEEIVITIEAPLSKPKEAALVLENNVFTFDSPPYFMRIKLPHPVCDRFNQQAYDNITKTYKIKLKKSNEDFQESSDEEDDEVLNSLQELKSLCLQEPPKDTNDSSSQKIKGREEFYGFANNYSRMFGKLYDEFAEVINLPNPDRTSVEDRRKLRLQEEDGKWDDDHYLADTMETDHLESVFNYKPPWVSSSMKDDLNNDEKEILAELISNSKNKKLTEEQEKMCKFQLVDVLYAYAYNKRTTEGDNTVESGWIINKLSSTLSWFEVFEDMKTVLLACYKRALIYPLYRNWKVCELIHKDVVSLIKRGPRQMTRCLIELRDVFNESENRYVLNTLYVNDLCNFAYHMTSDMSLELSAELEKIKIKKFEVNKELPLLEIAAHLVLEEETEGSEKKETNVERIVERIGKLSLLGRKKESCDSSESDTEDSSSSTQSSDKEN